MNKLEKINETIFESIKHVDDDFNKDKEDDFDLSM